ncbi:HAD family hydrolase [Dialister micraerophilus]|uniref:HAD family hydrolase n=1 Tax=Dialister micraerophilus TaxID=309120 RepID=UPI0025509D50|nr:HAD family hydrolase [Dialister micraerophilus]MDK8285683.1 HAD hydrolase-like protein [Dialister micraerophilus]
MKKVIFDIDGVLFSEENYFDVAALTIQEWLYDSIYLGLPTEADLCNIKNTNRGNISSTRYYLWGNDKLIHFLKSKGINSEWDMVHAYLSTTIGLMAREYFLKTGEKLNVCISTEKDIKKAGLVLMGLSIPGSEEILSFWQNILKNDANGIEIFDFLLFEFGKYLENVKWLQLQSNFWNMHKETFLNIYLGTNLFISEFGKFPYNGRKEGFIKFDKSLAPASKIKAMFQQIKQKGYKIAIATGRKRIETKIPFKQNNWLEEFDEEYIATVSDAEDVSKLLKCKIPDKPDPFIYYCAMLGRKKENYLNYLNGDILLDENDKYIIVGDSIADFLAAKKIGVSFIGITGTYKFSSLENILKNENCVCVDSVLKILDIL